MSDTETETETNKATLTIGSDSYDYDDLSTISKTLLRHINSIRQELRGIEDRIIILRSADLKLSEQLASEVTEVTVTEDEV